MLISCGGASSTGGRTGSGGTAATGGSSGIGGVSSTGGSRFLVVLVVPPEPPVELTWKPLLAPPVELDIAPPVPEVALEGDRDLSAGYEYEVHTWQWLKLVANAANPRLEIYLAYGKRDRYARASHLLAAVLPSDHVVTDNEGEHDWSTWIALWRRLLACCGHRLESGNVRQLQPKAHDVESATALDIRTRSCVVKQIPKQKGPRRQTPRRDHPKRGAAAA